MTNRKRYIDEGRAVRQIREKLGYKRGTLAVMLGYAYNSGKRRFKEIENGDRLLPMEKTDRLLQFVNLGLPADAPEPDLDAAREFHRVEQSARYITKKGQ